MAQLGAARRTVPAVLAVICAFALAARAQNPADMMPAESAAKARAILQQTIEALGGDAYLHLHTSDCTGRYAQFQHSGEIGGYIELRQYQELPDKSRLEYDAKGRIIDMYAGNQGWNMDRGGVADIPADEMADYLELLRVDLNYILRYRMNDPDLVFRYNGTDVVDLKDADWVEIGDHEGHTVRVAIDKRTHLPIRSVMNKRDPKTGEPTQRENYYSTYHPVDGVQMPFRVSRFLNGRQTYQVFLQGCMLNLTLPGDFFTRASLEQHFAELNGKGKGKK